MLSLILCLLSFSVRAVTLTKYLSTPQGFYQQTFELNQGKAIYHKTSNLFDPSPGDLRSGELITLADTSEPYKKLTLLDEQLKKVDQTLKDFENTDLKKIAGSGNHKVVIKLGEYVIPQESKYYQELDNQFRALQALKWKLDKGFELSTDLSEVSVFENGKLKKKESFPKSSYCHSSSSECTYFGGGKIRVNPKLL